MAKRGGQPGNSNGARGGQWRRAVESALKLYEGDKVKRGEALEKIAEKLVAAALAGEMSAIQEIACRLDGKPTEHKVIHKTIERRLTYAQRLALEEAKATAASRASDSPVGHTVQ